jgi:hypothetical protein
MAREMVAPSYLMIGHVFLGCHKYRLCFRKNSHIDALKWGNAFEVCFGIES